MCEKFACIDFGEGGRKKMKEELKGNTAITLISLIATIIVLLILAGVSVAMLTGENGILTQAQKAKDETEIANEKEGISLDVIRISDGQRK